MTCCSCDENRSDVRHIFDVFNVSCPEKYLDLPAIVGCYKGGAFSNLTNKFRCRIKNWCVRALSQGDDLILYAKATIPQANLINSILEVFDMFSGHKIRAKLSGWSSRSLSFAGRVTSANSVLNAMPCQPITCRPVASPNAYAMKLINYSEISSGAPVPRTVVFRLFNGALFVNHGLMVVLACATLGIRISLSSQSFVIALTHCSHLWRALGNVWPSFYEFLAWSVNDVVDDLLVCDVLTQPGLWSLPLLEQILSSQAIPYVMSIHYPTPSMGPKSCYWEPGKHGSELPWNIIFSSLAWHIWKQVNSKIFSGQSQPNYALLMQSKVWVSYCYSTLQDLRLPRAQVYVGGLIRNNLGDWLLGFNKYIGATQALHAELWGILKGLRLSRNNGFECVQCQTDCSEALNLVTSSTAHLSPIALVRAIAKLVSKS
ncbi:hypothetical protein F3Y22_tig00000170pilonHSYRG00041 [Hibiscus syriacus]|uniref:RNase H type-1 domain-containing protein n=1 Tax=Hibiscus syriacus TaxID=106335 RepID=A0A6A3D3Q9_HIBSY|nr:hypothetical protein F3Y22_tig00000170pilonHSYRG00041 [Hibiscus syriacus]